MRLPTFRSLLTCSALALTAACQSSTEPLLLDPSGVQADLAAAYDATTAPANVSFGALGGAISLALADAGGAVRVADLPAVLLKDPNAVVARAELRARIMDGSGTASAIPQAALGRTFEFDTIADRYVAGQRTGAPANGVRFILYAVDPVTEALVLPLVETGRADLTRTVTNQAITARVEAYSGGVTPVKVLDYAATVQGTVTEPTILVAGFVRNGGDSLTFTLASTISVATSTIALDWRTALPARGLTTRVQQTITGGGSPRVVLDGLLQSQGGNVGIVGTLVPRTGGTLTVQVNGGTFATIALDGLVDETPTILNAQDQPLTQAEQAMLRQILDWFEGAFDVYEDLLDPVERLLDIVT